MSCILILDRHYIFLSLAFAYCLMACLNKMDFQEWPQILISKLWVITVCIIKGWIFVTAIVIKSFVFCFRCKAVLQGMCPLTIKHLGSPAKTLLSRLFPAQLEAQKRTAWSWGETGKERWRKLTQNKITFAWFCRYSFMSVVEFCYSFISKLTRILWISLEYGSCIKMNKVSILAFGTLCRF